MDIATICENGALDDLLPELRRAMPGARVLRWPEPGAEEAEIAVCWRPPAGVLARMPRLRLIHAIAAGVDNILASPGLPDVPLCRIVDDGLAAAMAEFVHWGVLYFHRHFDRVIANARQGVWECPPQPLAAHVRVGLMGLGEMGTAAARRLIDTGYAVSAWTRHSRRLEGARVFSGDGGLDAMLGETDILVCLLPLTAGTARILDAGRLGRLPRGAALILASRGGHLVPDDLVAHLRSGHLRGAILDVFEEEPLGAAHPLWREPGVLVTPHMAGTASNAAVAARVAENVRRLRAGEPLDHLVDRARGY